MLSALLLSLLIGTTPAGEREVQNTQEPPLAAASKPTLTLPPQVQAQPGNYFVVKCDTNCKWVRWRIPAGLVRVDPKDTAYGDKGFVGHGPAGVYEFVVEGSLNDVHTDCKCVVFVGQPAPTPPGPAPAPSDPFTAELQPLFTADKGTADQRDRLIALWGSAAQQVDGNAEFKTMRDFTTRMGEVASVFPFNMTPDTLKSIREKLAHELTNVCGPGTTELGPPKSECRKKAAALFNKYAQGIGGCK